MVYNWEAEQKKGKMSSFVSNGVVKTNGGMFKHQSRWMREIIYSSISWLQGEFQLFSGKSQDCKLKKVAGCILIRPFKLRSTSNPDRLRPYLQPSASATKYFGATCESYTTVKSVTQFYLLSSYSKT